MFCHACGNSVGNGARFCAGCGAPAFALAGTNAKVKSTAAMPKNNLDYADISADAVRPAALELRSPRSIGWFSAGLIYPGPWMIRQNWKALGEEKRAQQSLYWFVGLIAYTTILILIPFDLPFVVTFTIPYVSWLLGDVLPQSAYLKNNNIIYRKKSVKWMVLSMTLLVVVCLCVGIYTGLAGR